MKALYSTLTFLLIIGCITKSKTTINQGLVKSDTMIKSKTEVFGDSLKIIYEYSGDTIIQKRIDLKGVSVDGFNNSYTVRSVWSTRTATELNCDKKLTFNNDSIAFSFCIDDAIKYMEIKLNKSSNNSSQIDAYNKIKLNLIKIKNGDKKDFSLLSYRLSLHFLKDIDFSIIDNKTNTKVKEVRIENYETNFSGGKNYYLINKNNDIITHYNVNEWMK